MTSQRELSQHELDNLFRDFFAEGPEEIADRVIDAALHEIEQIEPRRALRMPWTFPRMNMLFRVAAAAVIGVLLVSSTFYVIQHGLPAIGGQTQAPGATASPSPTAVGTPTPASTATSTAAPTPVPTPTAKPSPMALTGPFGAGRQIHTATLLADGRVLVAGGLALRRCNHSHRPRSYDPTTGTFSPTGSMATARALTPRPCSRTVAS